MSEQHDARGGEDRHEANHSSRSSTPFRDHLYRKRRRHSYCLALARTQIIENLIANAAYWHFDLLPVFRSLYVRMNMQARMSQWPLRRRRQKRFPPAAPLAENLSKSFAGLRRTFP